MNCFDFDFDLQGFGFDFVSNYYSTSRSPALDVFINSRSPD